jgi:hypothetical protein
MLGESPDLYDDDETPEPVKRSLFDNLFQPEVGERGRLTSGVPPPPEMLMEAPRLFDPDAETSPDPEISGDVNFLINAINNQKFEGVLQQDYAINTLIFNLYSIIKKEAIADPRSDIEVKAALKFISTNYKFTERDMINQETHNVIVYYYVLKHLVSTGRIPPKTKLYKIEGLLYPKMALSRANVGSKEPKQVSSSVASTGVPTTSVAPLTGAAASSIGYDPVGPLATTPQTQKRATSRAPSKKKQ